MKRLYYMLCKEFYYQTIKLEKNWWLVEQSASSTSIEAKWRTVEDKVDEEEQVEDEMRITRVV